MAKIIKYQFLSCEINHGTEEEPNIEQILLTKFMPYSEAELAIAKAEAYNGEVTVEDVPEPPMTTDEVRAKRDKLLAETDWTQVADAPIDTVTRTAMRVYRQQLRDITEQAGFPTDIVWPEMPTIVKATPEPIDEVVEAIIGVEVTE